MYCGDETGAFIGDIGSSTSRFGYGGEDNPKHVTPSYLSGNNTIPSSCYKYHDDLKPVYRMTTTEGGPIVDPNEFLQQGDVVENWDAMEEVWHHAFDVLRARDRFKHTKGGGPYQRITKTNNNKGKSATSTTVRASSVPEERCVHPIMAVRSGCTHVMHSGEESQSRRKELEQYTEMLFESLQVDSCFIAPSPMLAAFSHGRQTCLVVDVGASGCRVTPVVDGLVLKQAQRRTGRGGDWLGNIAWKALLEEKVTIVPRYQLRSDYDTTTKMSSLLFTQWAIRDLMFEFRTSDYSTLSSYRHEGYATPFCSPRLDESEEKYENPECYELPDGTTVNLETAIGRDLKRVPELLFTDDTPFIPSADTTTLDQHATLSNLPIHRLIHQSVGAVGDADIRKELCGNIVLVGGTALLPDMEQRLSYEVSNLISGHYKCKIVASKFSVERLHAPWIGASILTSLGSFQQLWLSRKEYDEYGATLSAQRFP